MDDLDVKTSIREKSKEIHEEIQLPKTCYKTCVLEML